MKSLTTELPDRLAEELGALVQAGWFSDEGEAVRLALIEFFRHQRRELEGRFQLEEIAWAVKAACGPRARNKPPRATPPAPRSAPSARA